MTSSVLLGAWAAAGLTLAIYSFLYEDNPFFKFGEHLYLGVSVGYGIAILIFKYMIPIWYTPLFIERNWTILVPTIFGILILTRFIPKIAWLSRWGFAFIIGYGAGMWIPRAITTYFLQQAQSTVAPLISRGDNGMGYTFGDFSNLVIIVGVLTVLIYFFFSIEHKGFMGGSSKVGRLFLMISFGASFGYTFMARISLLFGRFYDLLLFSSKQYYYATPVLLALIVLCLVGVRVLRKPASE